MTNALLKFERRLVVVEEALVFAFLVLILILSSAQMVSRFALDFPLGWTEELGRVAQIWLVFIGAAVAARTSEHFVLEFFMERMTFRGKHLIARAIDILVVGFFCVLAAITAQSTWAGSGQELPAMSISIAWSYAALPVGLILMAFHFAMSWLRPFETSATLVGRID